MNACIVMTPKTFAGHCLKCGHYFENKGAFNWCVYCHTTSYLYECFKSDETLMTNREYHNRNADCTLHEDFFIFNKMNPDAEYLSEFAGIKDKAKKHLKQSYVGMNVIGYYE